MKVLTNHTEIKHNGQTVAVVVPIADYLDMTDQQDEEAYTIPHEVVQMVVEKGFSPVKAWRVHASMPQSAIYLDMGISQSAYSQLESRDIRTSRKETRESLCKALEIGHEGMITDLYALWKPLD